jgi:peptide/nickel transport system ATP-binding protein
MFGSEIASDGALLLEQLGIRKEWLGRYPHELSGGELQRFCLARALATGPQFLIADEISTMLDALTQAVLWKVIIELQEQQGFGIVFVSHSPALVRRLATDAVYL